MMWLLSIIILSLAFCSDISVKALSIAPIPVVTQLIPTTVSWSRNSSNDADNWYFVGQNQLGTISDPIPVPYANAPNGEVNILFIRTG
ncbi:hypothetical protein VKT23_013363 [Stygiomarasmius scandens]|uniref:Uncharacterized protein n=1 Tax=Marasmiellus scandens TaxID=2682957 RepID=A0ABR1J359_9AGAR